jgi:hypothetical protein
MKAIFSFIFFLLTCFTSIAQTEKNALFIGNSYTYVNDLPGIIQEIALSKGNIFSHQSHTPGGSTLAQHASNPTVQNLLNSEDPFLIFFPLFSDISKICSSRLFSSFI